MKKILSALLVFASLLSCLVACDRAQNIPSTTENVPQASTADRKIGSTVTTPWYPPTENPSIANCDVSTYQGIVDLFRNIVNYYPTYTEEKMLSNECDGVELIAEEEIKELYKSLFISGYRLYFQDYAYKYNEDGRNYFGYSVTDLNQNGSDELILLTDLYNIVAIFSMEGSQPKLVLDNFETDYNYRIDDRGRIYAQNIGQSGSILYTQIYSLDKHDALNLEEEYFCIDYNYVNEKQCYAVTNGEEIQISIPEWEALSHGWVGGYTAGIITKTNAQFDFVRLFGGLNLYLPELYSWDCYSFQFDSNENILFISNLSDNALIVELYDATAALYQRKVFVRATLVGNIATFEAEEISGCLQFGLDSIWLIIESSNLSSVPCGTYLYTEISYGKG